MEEVCRTCLGIIDTAISPCYEIETNESTILPTSTREKIHCIVSEMDLDISKRSVICNQCNDTLDIVFEFRMKCLKTEEVIRQYIQSKPEIQEFCLKHVLEETEMQEEEQNNIEMVTIKQEFSEGEESMNNQEPEVNNFELVEIKKEVVVESQAESDSDSDYTDEDNASDKALEQPIVTDPLVKKHKALYTCNLCKSEFSIKTELNKHLKEHAQNSQILECNICQKSFSRRCYLNYHMTMHTGDSRHNCKLCDKKYTRRDILRKHLKKHHNIDVDTAIDQDSSTMADDASGVKVATSAMKYHCDICQREFAQEIFLRHHKATHTEDRPFKCDVCNSSFKAKNTLALHKRKHMVSRNIQCEYCNKQFHSVGYLREHLRTHTGEKIFECNLCDQKFALKPSLRKHIFSHSDEKTFKCDICNRKFYSDEELVTHRVIHNTGKTFSCNMCTKTFGTKNNLKSHMTTHNETRPFPCFKCSKAFNRRLGLKHHIMSMHKDIDIRSVVIEKYNTTLMTEDNEAELKNPELME